MKKSFLIVLVLPSIFYGCASQGPETSRERVVKTSADTNVISQSSQEIVQRYTQGWPETSVKAATELITKYGEPQEATGSVLIWKDVIPFKRISVFREGVNHRFPILHKDVVEHVVDYRVPASKIEDLVNFNGSLSFDRTRGELTSFCGDEMMNLASINLAHELIINQMQPEEARNELGRVTVELMNGTKDRYVQGLQFGRQLNTGDADRPTKFNWARQAEETNEMKEYKEPINRSEIKKQKMEEQETTEEEQKLLEKAQREELTE